MPLVHQKNNLLYFWQHFFPVVRAHMSLSLAQHLQKEKASLDWHIKGYILNWLPHIMTHCSYSPSCSANESGDGLALDCVLPQQ